MKKMMVIVGLAAGMMLGGCRYDKSAARNLCQYVAKDGSIIVTDMDMSRRDYKTGLGPVYYKKKVNGKFGDWQEVWCNYDTGSSGNYSYRSLDGKFIFANNWSSYPEGYDKPPITVEYEENGEMVEKYMK